MGGTGPVPTVVGVLPSPRLLFALLCIPFTKSGPLRFTHRAHHTGSMVLRSAPAQGPAVGRKLKWGRKLKQSSSSDLRAQFLDPPSSLTSLTYFSFPFREHVQQSQEHGKVSARALPHLIAIPPSLNDSPRLPLWQHLLTFLQQEASPGCGQPYPVARLCLLPELQRGGRWERNVCEQVQGCWAGPSL